MTQLFKAGITYFALVFGLGFLLGLNRVPFIVPQIGVRKAELLETPFMLFGIVLAAAFVLKQFTNLFTPLQTLIVGIVALTLTITAKWLAIIYFQKITFKQYMKSRDPVSGRVYVLLLILFALMPFMLNQINQINH